MKSHSKRPRLNTDECLTNKLHFPSCTSVILVSCGGISDLCENRAENETAASVDLLKQTPPGYSLLEDSHWEASGCVSVTANAATSGRGLTKIPISAVESESESSTPLSDTQLKNVKLGFPLHCFSSGCQHIKHYLKGGLI